MNKKFVLLLIFIFLSSCFMLFINLNTGFIPLQFEDFISPNSENYQIAQFRIYRILTMILAGISVPTSGFILQEYFQNPLAGPSVLGISSAASLSVASYILFSKDIMLPDFLQYSFISISAISSGLLLMVFLIYFAHHFQDKSFIIIFGFLISALCGAVVSILQFYSENQSLKNYIIWSFGSNNQLSENQIIILSILTLAGSFLIFKTIKPLIGIGLGSEYAQSLGVNIVSLKYLIIISSSLLSTSITAFLGPLLFIGIIVPHFCRLIWNPAQLWHQWILNITIGIFIMISFSIFSEISQFPINIISSIFGIPVIILMLINKKKQY